MRQELIRIRTMDGRTMGGTRTLVERTLWRWLALTAILVLPAFLNLWDLTGEGYSNYYYAAAVKNVLTGWHNFVSFDAGFVSVDKPPLGLWIQAASAYVFGFHGWIVLLPQAIAGVLSVALVYHLVHSTFGAAAGVLSALVLALTPIVVTSRNNTMDWLLVAEERGLRTSKVLVARGKDLDSGLTRPPPPLRT
jgi:4-amino-4-deoxy-L-arabinose transferase-like glycosyltransferase